MKKYDYAVFIGRFQPFHNGHFEAIRQALAQSNHIIILVGSSFTSSNIKNPFSWPDRREMISEALYSEGTTNFTVMPLQDFFYSDNSWIAQVQKRVGIIAGLNSSIGLVSYKKDHSSYYLDLFPKWGAIKIEIKSPINASDIRRGLFEGAPGDTFPVNSMTRGYLSTFVKTAQCKLLKSEWKANQEYRKLWAGSPFPPIFVTTDAVVVSGGHILLVKRKASPGKGLLALPGGFIKETEQLQHSCIRELREETRIKVPPLKIKGCIEEKKVFDHPLRSTRGRTITHAFYINLKNEQELPKVKGGDDASHAFWMNLAEVSNKMEFFFEDHYQIIDNFINLPQRAE